MPQKKNQSRSEGSAGQTNKKSGERSGTQGQSGSRSRDQERATEDE
jgi:hypothetical protein